MKKIFIIDFDGTISNRDSFILFSFFSVKFYRSLLYWSAVLFERIFSTKSNSQLKEKFFNNFNSISINDFQKICNDFESKILVRTIKKSFIKYIDEVKPRPDIVIVSASIKNYLQPWCARLKFDLISTELEVVDGKLSGKFFTPNCNGKEKVRRINEKYELSKYDEIYVFGNSKGDLPILELGTHKYYRFFK